MIICILKRDFIDLKNKKIWYIFELFDYRKSNMNIQKKISPESNI